MTSTLSCKFYFALISVLCIAHIKPVQPLEIKALDQLRENSRLSGPLESAIQGLLGSLGIGNMEGMNAEEMSSEAPSKGSMKSETKDDLKGMNKKKMDIKPSDSPSNATMQSEKKNAEKGKEMDIKPSDSPSIDKTMSDDDC